MMELLACCWLLCQTSRCRATTLPHTRVFSSTLSELRISSSLSYKLFIRWNISPERRRLEKEKSIEESTDETAIADVRPQASCCVIG